MGPDGMISNSLRPKRTVLRGVAEHGSATARFGPMRVFSEAIAEIDYRPRRRELFVRFTSGASYLYADVPAEEARAFAEADSKGGYFAANIRDRHVFRRLDS